MHVRLFQYLATAMLANPVRRTMCASLAMTPGQVAQASKVAQHTECEHVGTCPDIVLIQSTCGSSPLWWTPRAVGRKYAKQIGEADAEHTSRRSLFQIVQGVFVAKSGVWAVNEF